MSDFLSNIIGRHAHPENSISPRPRSLFEQEHSIPDTMVTPAQPFRDQKPSLAETIQHDEGKNDRENANKKGENQELIRPTVDRALPFTIKEENAMPILNPSTEKKADQILRKSNLQVNSDNKTIQEGIPSPSASPNTMEKSYGIRSPDQKPEFKVSNGSYQVLENLLSPIPDETIKEEKKPGTGILKTSTNFEDSLERSKSYSQKLSENPGSLTDKKHDNPDPVKEMQNLLPSQEKIVGNRDFRISMNDYKQVPPTIRITIGRIEIKAVKQQKNTFKKNQEPSNARISLNEFLDKKGN